jgi:hypothetical protein
MAATSSSFTPAKRSQTYAPEQGKGTQSAKALFSKSKMHGASSAHPQKHRWH